MEAHGELVKARKSLIPKTASADPNAKDAEAKEPAFIFNLDTAEQLNLKRLTEKVEHFEKNCHCEDCSDVKVVDLTTKLTTD